MDHPATAYRQPCQPLAQPSPCLGLDRARLQRLIDVLNRYDLSSDSADTTGLSSQLRALAPLLS